MPIEISCDCGKRLRAKDELAGKKAKCPGCGTLLAIPEPRNIDDDIFGLAEPDFTAIAPPPEPAPMTMPDASFAQPEPAYASAPVATSSKKTLAYQPMKQLGAFAMPSVRQWVFYGILLLAMLPLTFSVLSNDSKRTVERLIQTVTDHPEVADKLESDDDDAFFAALPDHRINGAFLAHDTKAHWGMALLASAGFCGLVLGLVPRAGIHVGKLIGIGLFTATIGILLLLGVQLVADWTDGRWMVGRSILMIFFYIAKFIGFSYRAALDPDTNIILSALGFTFGVGMCEEICKALPLLVHYRGKADWGWRTACAVGLISGVGFGVSEGIHYAGDNYNGITEGSVYMVRFVSCVALHAIWSGAAAIFIYRQQNLLQGAESLWGVMGYSVVLVAIPMTLHGFYDTLLKKDHDLLALIVALVSIGWLVWQMEKAKRDLDEDESPAMRPAFAR